MEHSIGHICFAQRVTHPEITETTEFFERNGNIFRAPLSNAVMPDGFRTGRLECNTELWKQYGGMILGAFDRLIES